MAIYCKQHGHTFVETCPYCIEAKRVRHLSEPGSHEHQPGQNVFTHATGLVTGRCHICKEDIYRFVADQSVTWSLIPQPKREMTKEEIDHPAHYGGADNPYEAKKVIRAWELGFNLGNLLKYVKRAGKKFDESQPVLSNVKLEAEIKDLKKGRWYLDDEIAFLEALLEKRK